MNKSLAPITCKNCGNTFQGNYCNTCGQKVIDKRFTLKLFLRDALSVFNLERGFFFTVDQLFRNPGNVLKEYLSGRTKDYYHPLKYIILLAGLSTIFVLITNTFDNTIEFTSRLAESLTEESASSSSNLQSKMQEILRNYINVVAILMVPFFALSFRIFFARSKLYYGEHMIVSCYALGTSTLISILFTIISGFFPNLMVLNVTLGFGTQFLIFAIFYSRLLNKNIIISFLLSTVSIIFGFIIMLIFSVLIGSVIGIVLKKMGVI